MSTVVRRFSAAFTISTATMVVTMAGQIFAVPLYLAHWGAPVYGEWLALTNLGASLSVLNLGVQSYVTNDLVMHYVRGQITEGTRVLHAAIRLYAVLACLIIVIAGTLAFMPGVPALLRIRV